MANSFWYFLKQEKVPIGWSLLTSVVSAIAGAIFVLWVVPHFNKGFENNKIRSSFVISKMTQLDSAANVLAVSANRYIQGCMLGNEEMEDLAVEFQEAKFQMDLRAIEIVALLKDTVESDDVLTMQRNLSELNLGYICPDEVMLADKVDQVVRFKTDVLIVLDTLSDAADL